MLKELSGTFMVYWSSGGVGDYSIWDQRVESRPGSLWGGATMGCGHIWGKAGRTSCGAHDWRWN